MIRVVLDTNVWLSGLLWGGIPRQVLGLREMRKLKSSVLMRFWRNLA